MKTAIKILVILFIVSIFISYADIAYADEDDKNLNQTIDEMLDSIDLNDLEKYYNSIPQHFKNDSDLKSYLKRLFSMEDFADYDSILLYCTGTFLKGFKEKLPLFITLFALLVISGLISATASSKGKGVTEIARFAVYAAVICTITAIAYSLLEKGKSVIEGISAAVETVFPIILTLMTVTGSSASVAAYSPSVAFISNFAVLAAKNLIFPIIVFMLAVSVISNINSSVKLKNLFGFCASSLKWILGLLVTLFSVFLTVKGLSAGTFDGISIRAVKYTINSSVPIVGGLVKDGLDFILAAAVLIKNSLGVFAIIYIFGAAIGPILEIAAISLSLKFVNAVTEPIGDGKSNDFINSVSASLNFLTATIITISVMYLALLFMVVYSSQVIL